MSLWNRRAIAAEQARSTNDPGDRLGRGLLCAAFSAHDPSPEGVCRDCGRTLAPSDPVCADDVLIHAQPDQEQP